MTSSSTQPRDAILNRIRASLRVSEGHSLRESAVQERLKRHPRGPVPTRATSATGEALIALVARLKAQGATVAEAAHADEVPRLVADYLRSNNLPARLRMGSDAFLSSLPWQNAGSIEVLSGPAQPGDEVSLSKASSAAAESGTLILTSGRENPTSLNFLPDTQIVVLRAQDIASGYEVSWDRLRSTCAAGWPRTVNWISGPSRTADIEQTIVMGAHGPRRLHVILAV
jgi:L-lactate dehydrogenase complex protein LldG